MNTPKERAIKTARDFSNSVNEMSFDAQAFAQELRRDHRTIQQNTMKVIMELVRQWSDDHDSGNFDLRNEDTVKMAKDITQNVDTIYLRYI
jgi:hypothetical protein